MLTKDLIKVLQKLIEDNEPHKEIFGEHTIMIDVFDLDKGSGSVIEYRGFSPDIRITKSSDGVYDILTAWL